MGQRLNADEINTSDQVAEGQDHLSFFLESDERLMALLSRGYLSNYLLGSTFSKDFVALSDRRLYYAGSSFGRMGSRIERVKANVVVPLEHVSSAVFVSSGNVALLFLTFLVGAVSLAAAFAGADSSDGASFLVLALPALLWVAYLFTRKRVLQVSSNSATVEIRFDLYGEEAVAQFLCALGKTSSLRRELFAQSPNRL